MKIFGITLAIVLTATASAWPQVPPDIAARLRTIGPTVDPAATAAIYRPLHRKAPYPGVTVTRDISYGPDPRQIIDVFAPALTIARPPAVPPAVTAPPVAPPAVPAVPAAAPAIAAPRPVLVFVSGGAGNKIERVPDGDAFYDNVMLWAVKNGMTGVNVQRLGGTDGGLAAANDVALVIQWIQQNIARYSGDPNRVFIWAHSSGTGPVAAYVASPETPEHKGHGLDGAVLMGASSAILPPAVVAAVRKTGIPLFVGAGEIDVAGAVTWVASVRDGVRDETCDAACPTTMLFRDHSHMSAVFSPNTADDSVTGPILKWMSSVK